MANFQPLPSFPGEPVDTHLQADTPDYAPWIRRAGAYVIDGAFGVAVATANAIATGHHNPFNTFSWHLVNGKEQLRPIGSKLLFFNATVIGVEVIYTIGFFVSTWQATLGMRLLGITHRWYPKPSLMFWIGAQPHKEPSIAPDETIGRP